MRSALHGPEAYLLKSKKPHIQELVKLAETMTEEEINSLPEKPDVIKGLLNIRKKANQDKSAVMAEILADMMQSAYNKS